MDEMITEFTTEESQHPVLQGLKDKIASLEADVASLQIRNNDLTNAKWEQVRKNGDYKTKLENVLRHYAQDDEDNVSVCTSIAEDMGINLENSKDFEINVTFTVTVTAPFGEEIELSEYDIDACLNGIGVDEYDVQSTDVIFITEA